MAEQLLPISFDVYARCCLLFLGIVAPSCSSTPHRLWLKLGAVISKIGNPIILAPLFFLVVTPMVLVMQTARNDHLRRVPDRNATTHWVERESPSTVRCTLSTLARRIEVQLGLVGPSAQHRARQLARKTLRSRLAQRLPLTAIEIF